MSTVAELDGDTRAALDMTVGTIARLGSTLQNYIEEEVAVLSLIQTLEIKLQDAREKHAYITANIASIRQSVMQMKAAEQTLRGTLSPIKYIPNDIMLAIFRMLVQDTDSRNHDKAASWTLSSPLHKCVPLRLGWVCRRWRSIMATNSHLWTTLTIGFEANTDKTRDIQRQLVSRWKTANKTTHIAVFIEEDKHLSNMSLCTLLGTGPTEWRAIHILTDEGTFEGIWDAEVHSAREVTIYSNRRVGLTFFIPLMRQASILVLYGTLPEWGNIPWIHLRSFTLKSHASLPEARICAPLFGTAAFRALLIAATQLNDLTLDFGQEEDVLERKALHRTTHRNLSFISLHLHHFVSEKGPFGIELSAPSLHTLDLISLKCRVSVDSTRSPCRWDEPKVLSLPSMDDDEVIRAAELVKWLPNVHTLRVTGRNVDSLFTFIHSLFHHVPPQSGPLPLPKVTSLYIKDTDLRGETLIELLESKLRHLRGNTAGVCAITNVKMYNSPAVTVAHWSRVQELLREGLDAIIIDGSGQDG